MAENTASLIKKRERSHRIEHYWLCDQCAGILTLAYERGRGIVTVPLPDERAKIPPASEWNEVGSHAPYFERNFVRRA